MLRVRLLVVDDNPAFLNSALRFLASYPEIEVVGQALSGDEALDQVTRLRPDMVLMDLVMPETNGLEAARIIKALPDAPRVVIMTLYDSAEYRAAVEATSADGFVAKSEFGTQLLALLARQSE